VRLLHAQRVEALIMAGSGLDGRSYSQAMIDMGARAMGLALEPSDPELRAEHLPTEVVIRASTGSPQLQAR
jgi:hypothetical protein